MKKYELNKLENGNKFTYGGVSWVLLEKTETTALCIAETTLFNKEFDKDNCNNWAKSSLRKYLNTNFIKELATAGADRATFIPFVTDLTADDGLKDYGQAQDQIGLITCDLYRKFRLLIPNANNWWWTATPYSTPSNGYSHYVRRVGADGTLNGIGAYGGFYGVRPLCNLNSSILVEVEE